VIGIGLLYFIHQTGLFVIVGTSVRTRHAELAEAHHFRLQATQQSVSRTQQPQSWEINGGTMSVTLFTSPPTLRPRTWRSSATPQMI
jgi:hypothetical protein